MTILSKVFPFIIVYKKHVNEIWFNDDRILLKTGGCYYLNVHWNKIVTHWSLLVNLIEECYKMLLKNL